MMLKFIRITLFTFALMALTGYGYPMLVTAMAQGLFPHQAHGSLIEQDGKIIGSELIAQSFTGVEYFHPRPSAAGAGYEANNSGASNLSVTNKKLNETYAERVKALKVKGQDATIPADLITASGSGLDPHITPESARYQADRVAKARKAEISTIEQLIKEHTEGRTFGFLGMPRVNVLALNLALDRMDEK